MSNNLIRFLFLTVLFLTVSCENSENKVTQPSIPAAPDYTQSTSWFQNKSISNKLPADVFYVAPTCIWDWKDKDGTSIHYMDIGIQTQREAVEGPLRMACRLFEDHCCFFAPYYRQITMESWMEGDSVTEARYPLAHEDIIKAFQRFRTLRSDRPFILAGHSQGAKAVLELIKHTLTPEQLDQMIAAYLIGFTITADELSAFPQIRPAQDAYDTGVCICFNSVSDTSAISPLFRDNVVCINPMNWKTDATPATPAENMGSVFFNADMTQTTDTLTDICVTLDKNTHTLIVDGLNPDQYYIPSISQIFPRGNYHVQEINLYFNNLKQNIATRIKSYLNGKRQTTAQ